MIVNLRLAFHVSWANKLQFEKTSCAGVLETTKAASALLAKTFDKEVNSYATSYGTNPLFGLRRR